MPGQRGLYKVSDRDEQAFWKEASRRGSVPADPGSLRRLGRIRKRKR